MAQYRALYRQWRPQTFAEVVGQEHVTRTLLNAVKNGRLVHAYLFCGPRGTGKTSTAKILAKAVNCRSSSNGEPCNKCPNCTSINKGSSLDVLEIDAASNRGIDEARELIEKIPLGPVEGRYKVYIIDEVHMLTTEAFNALLKTLEEPPGHAIFILATTEPRKVLPTILSRCQRFDFQFLTADVIAVRLQEVVKANGLEIQPGALSLLSRKAAGGLRDALSMLDQVMASGIQDIITVEQVAATLGTAQPDLLLRLVDALEAGDGAEMLRLVDSALRSGVEPKQLLEDLLDYTRNLLLLQMDSGSAKFTGLLPEEAERVIAQAQKFSNWRLMDLMERLQQGGAALRWSSQPRILLEMTLAGFIVSPAPSLEDLRQKVEAIEKRLAALSGGTTAGVQAAAVHFQNVDRQKERDKAYETAGSKKRDMKSVAVQAVRKDQQQEKNTGDLSGRESTTQGSAAKEEMKRESLHTVELELPTVREKWPDVLALARQKNVRLQAYLLEGRPVAVEKNKLTLEVKTDFHRGMLEQPGNRQKVEAVLEKIFRQPLKLVVTAGKESVQAAVGQEEIDKLKEFFGSDKVEVID